MKSWILTSLYSQGDDPGASPPRMERDALQTIPPGAEDHPLLSGVHFMAGMQEGPGAGETSRSEQTPKEETDSDDEDAPLALARHRHKKVAKRAQEVKEEVQDEGGDLTFDRERFEAFKTNRQRELKELFGDAATDTFIKKTISRHAHILTLSIYPRGGDKGKPGTLRT